MFVFTYSFLMFFAESGHGEGGFLRFYNEYLNIPGFEIWKFVNLAIFIAIAVYLGKKKLTPAFIARREAIRAELIKAEQEKQAALERLTAAEAERLAREADTEIERLRQQSGGEIGRLALQTKAELRRFSAEESIRLAEEKLRSQIDAQKDSGLVRASIQAIGGLN
jgi:F0F1-type ATP synthase membrane subunit b/b'